MSVPRAQIAQVGVCQRCGRLVGEPLALAKVLTISPRAVKHASKACNANAVRRSAFAALALQADDAVPRTVRAERSLWAAVALGTQPPGADEHLPGAVTARAFPRAHEILPPQDAMCSANVRIHPNNPQPPADTCRKHLLADTLAVLNVIATIFVDGGFNAAQRRSDRHRREATLAPSAGSMTWICSKEIDAGTFPLRRPC